jgi:two-component system capsular synthesis sensor histidine kinase RcsC
MTNLLGNAVKFTDQGSVRLEARARVAGGRAALELSVRDTGQGIAPEDQARIFERFVQLDSSPARQSEGTGLGLAISRKLAEIMDGGIEVESAPGAGSTFTLRVVMPLAEEQDVRGVAA